MEIENNGLSAGIDAATSKVVNKGGRPPGSKDSYKRGTGGAGAVKKPAGATIQKPSASQATDDAPYTPSKEEIEFVAQLAEDGIRLLESICVNAAGQSVFNSTNDTKLAQSFADKLKVQDKSIVMVKGAAGACAVKYAFLTRFAPELTIASFFLGYGFTAMQVFKECKEIAKMSAAVNKNKSHANQPQANQDPNSGQVG
jgi:hypothetical protein